MAPQRHRTTALNATVTKLSILPIFSIRCKLWKEGWKMGARESLQKLIDRKSVEIDRLEGQLRDARVYIQAVQDSFKLLPREENGEAASKELRPGSALAQVQEFLKREGAPQHISTILEFLGKPLDKQSRVSLSGSLGGYARDHRIFTKTGPNTFGLIEFDSKTNQEDQQPELPGLPDDFGKM